MAQAIPAVLDDMPALLAFVKVVDGGSFSAAARALGTTTSAISKRIAQLEERLGAVLLHRTTRRLSLTAAGRLLHQRAQSLLAELAAAERELADLSSKPRGTVRVSGPVTFGHMHLAGLIADFLIANPEITVELQLSDRFVDVVGERFDLAIRSGRSPSSSLKARKLAKDERLLVAAPRYLSQHGAPRVPSDLSRHHCMRHMDNNASGVWSFRGPQGVIDVKVKSCLHINHGGAIREAALRGLGIALLPRFVVEDELRRGLLVPVLSDHPLPSSALYAVFPASGRIDRATRALVDWLAARLPAQLGQT